LQKKLNYHIARMKANPAGRRYERYLPPASLEAQKAQGPKTAIPASAISVLRAKRAGDRNKRNVFEDFVNQHQMWFPDFFG